MGKRALESLIRVGALDDFGSRTVFLEQVESLSRDSGKHHQVLSADQMTLFVGEINGIPQSVLPIQTMEASKRRWLAWEKEILGVDVSDHPIASKVAILGGLISH